MTLILGEPEGMSVDRAGEMYACAEDLWQAREALDCAANRASKAGCERAARLIGDQKRRVERRARWTEEEADRIVESDVAASGSSRRTG
jgi:hypothetical protein